MKKYKKWTVSGFVFLLSLITVIPANANMIQERTAVIYTDPHSVILTTNTEDMIQQYAEDLKRLENNQEETLSTEESEAGYQIIDGQKYSPEEAVGDEYGEIDYKGAEANSKNGQVTFVMVPPEYIHETAYVTVINQNTLQMYGCTMQEQNGFEESIFLPPGNYMIEDGGLVADTTSRFYVRPVSFYVKSGSVQNQVIEIMDAKPELADQAHPEETKGKPAEETESITETETVELQKSARPDVTQTVTEKEETSVFTIILLTILFTGIPIIGLLLYYKKKKKDDKFQGFDH